MTPTSFSYTVPNGVLPAVNGVAGTATAIAATESGTTATITTAANHPFLVGQSVAISGFSVGGYNGTFAITAVTPTSFSFTANASSLPTINGLAAITNGNGNPNVNGAATASLNGP